MITDLFKNATCKICGDSDFERVEILPSDYGTDFVCICHTCKTLFVKGYERQAA